MTKLHKAPSPKGHLLLGNLPEFSRDILGFLDRSQQTCGDMIRVRLGHKIAHIACHPALAEQVLIADNEHFVKISQVKANFGLPLLTGNGLVTSYGNLWRRQRNLINPVFRPKAVEKQIDSIMVAGNNLVNRLNENAISRAPIDIWHESLRTSLNAAQLSLFGMPLKEDFDKINDAFTTALHYCFDSTRNPFARYSWLPTVRNREFKNAINILDDYVGSLVRHRLNSGIEQDDFIGTLLNFTDKETGDKLPLSLIRDEAITMIGAGHETSASALTSALIHISKHPQILQQIRQELRDVVGNENLNSRHIRQLRYLQAVVQETLRLSGPVPLIPRAVTKDVTIRDYRIPGGTIILVSVYNIHRHHDFWQDAYQFNPNRFFKNEGVLQKHRCAYIPFGAGERFCIGSNFGATELTIFLAQIVGNFDLQLVYDTVPMDVAISMRPNGPVNMIVEKASPVRKYHVVGQHKEVKFSMGSGR